MTKQHIPVTFHPHGRTTHVLAGTTVLETAARAGLALNTPCGGNGTCGKCRVRITKGAPPPNASEQQVLAEKELQEGWRLGCQTHIEEEAEIFIPESSLIAGHHQIQESSSTDEVQELQPIVRKRYVEMTAPTLQDDIPDLMRLEKNMGELNTDIQLLRELPRKLRQQEFKGTAVVSDHTLLDFEEGDTSCLCYGAAFDIGTTTIVGSLLNFCTGEEKAVTSRMNPQVRRGDDVLSRIRHSSSSPSSLQELQTLVIDEINSMIDDLVHEADTERRYVYDVIFAGNTTMQHMLCGLDTAQLGEIPFVPVHRRGLSLWADELNIPINPRGLVYVFPVIGGFVGGDTVAGILATQLSRQEDPVLMVDIGTNGEIVLAHNGSIYAASTAAGPAFEGSRLSCGMRATNGAIEKVVINDELACGVIGGVAPSGLCGSGLIDLVAELIRLGVISPEGHLPRAPDISADIPENLRERIKVDDNGEKYFVVVEDEHNAEKSEVVITQSDIRELQLAAGAVRAGTEILLKRAGLEQEDLKRVLIAGGFGSFIRRKHAQRIGLLPSKIDHRAISYVGNVTLSGAKWALLSIRAREQAEKYAKETEHMELSTDMDFQTHFAEAMIFP